MRPLIKVFGDRVGMVTHHTTRLTPSLSIVVSTAPPTTFPDRNDKDRNVVGAPSSIREIDQDLIGVIEWILANYIEYLVVLDEIVEPV
jgi:hypothetical protein